MCILFRAITVFIYVRSYIGIFIHVSMYRHSKYVFKVAVKFTADPSS